MIVAPTTVPSGRKCCSIPTFRPSRKGFAISGASVDAVCCVWLCACSSVIASPSPDLQLDLDVDAGWQVELHQRVDRLLRRIVDVNEPLVRADFELLARILVDERRADDRVLLDVRRQRHRTGDGRPGPLRGLDDLRGRLVDQLVVVGLEPDPDSLLRHLSLFPLAHSMTLVTTPAPTVLPPSRMAKRSPSS